MKFAAWAFALGFSLITIAHAEDPIPDPFLSPDATPGNTSTLATPVTPEPTAESTTPAPPPSQPESQPPIPVNSIPGKTAVNNSLAPPKPVTDIYEEYDQYLERSKEREGTENDYRQRNLFAHENGAWQISLDYAHRAFGNFNFNSKSNTPNATLANSPVFADTQGGGLSFTFFPIKSLTFGRLGFGAQAGIYFSKFSVDTTGTQSNTAANIVAGTAKRHSIDSYGVKAVYEFDYFLGQMFVPFITASFDTVRVQGYKVISGPHTGATTVLDFPAQTITSQGYGAGVHFNLNRIEPVVGSRALVNVGVRKFYLTYAATDRVGKLSGLTHSLGLRFEF